MFKTFKMSKIEPAREKAVIKAHRTPEIGSGLVRIAHKISSVSSEPQVIKIGEKYFRVRELG
ncbi:hypothetical protein B0A63_11050 [Flavobacterium johnsoniae UW101]|nr:hypothetical protein B0A63_11050 [Flavobacterium johnsoniae UW101]